MSAQRHEMHLLTGGYALDALPEAERAEFERHLTRCPACAEEVRGLRETAARLAMATAVAPPPGMRERVLAVAPRTRQLPPAGRGPLARAGERTGLRRISLSRAGLTAGIVTLAAAVALLVVMQVSTSRQLHQAQASNSAIAAVVAAPDARIQSAPAATGGTVTAVMSLRQHEAVITTADLQTLPGTRVYQLWVMNSSGAARSVGLLTITRPGSTAPVLATGVLPGDRLGITVEPSGGTAQPTTTPLVILPVTA
ncbi:MAG TPA: anti-sigma factor [Trebonia sp.]|nr:anti-sigma factor [Trebonia sp.]